MNVYLYEYCMVYENKFQVSLYATLPPQSRSRRNGLEAVLTRILQSRRECLLRL